MKIESLNDILAKKEFINVENVYLVNDDEFSWLPDSSIDLILTDPPFNIARDTNFHTYEGNTINSYRFDADKGWDSHSPEAFRKLLNSWSLEFARVLRPGGSFAIFCADEYLSDLIGSLKAAKLKPRRTLTWRKPNAVPINRKHMMMSACEYVVVGVKGSKSIFNADIDFNQVTQITEPEIVAIADKAAVVLEQEIRKALANLGARPTPERIEEIVKRTILEATNAAAKRSVNIYKSGRDSAELCVPNYVTFNSKAGGRLHPTEKPVSLLRYLTELLSNPGEWVLDPFAGSASMGETALSTNRRAILVEKESDFYGKGTKRLEEWVKASESILFQE